MSNEDGTFWVLFNGEIYNYPELRNRTLGAGPQVRNAAPTPKRSFISTKNMVRAVSRRLRGMFAIALWDSQQSQTRSWRGTGSARSRCFYAADRQRIIFGSELKALLAGRFELSRDMDRTGAFRLLFVWLHPGAEDNLPRSAQGACLATIWSHQQAACAKRAIGNFVRQDRAALRRRMVRTTAP